MKPSSILYLIASIAFGAAITTEVMEKREERKRQAEVWTEAGSGPNGSSSSPSSEQQPSSSPTDAESSIN